MNDPMCQKCINPKCAATFPLTQSMFACPECGDEQRRPANHRVVSILLATGVAYEVREDRGPITESEIAQFSDGLDRVDWAEQLG